MIDQKKLKKDEAVFNVLREYIKASKRIRFDGDGYSPEWEAEAAKRKLSNNKTTPKALQVLTSKKSLELFASTKVMSEVEVAARLEVELDTYILQTQIEGRVYNELVYNHIIPAAISYQNKLIENVTGLKEIYGAAYSKYTAGLLSIVEQISEHLVEIKKKTDDMTDARKRANNMKDLNKKAFAYCDDVRPYFDNIRYHSDKLEQLVQNDIWPLAKYRELLFIK